MVTSTIRLPNRDINFPQSITLNCEYSVSVGQLAEAEDCRRWPKHTSGR